MLRTETFGFRLSSQEKALLALVAKQEVRTASDVLRLLIRREALRRGLLPGISNAQYQEGRRDE